MWIIQWFYLGKSIFQYLFLSHTQTNTKTHLIHISLHFLSTLGHSIFYIETVHFDTKRNYFILTRWSNHHFFGIFILFHIERIFNSHHITEKRVEVVQRMSQMFFIWMQIFFQSEIWITSFRLILFSLNLIRRLGTHIKRKIIQKK